MMNKYRNPVLIPPKCSYTVRFESFAMISSVSGRSHPIWVPYYRVRREESLTIDVDGYRSPLL